MSFGYRLAYLLGLTPWEKAGAGFGHQLSALLERVEVTPGPRGRALDLGCGTGDHSIELAQRGWQVTGVDFVGQAVDAARKKAAKAGVEAQFFQGDVTALDARVGTGYRLVLDVGCFHGLEAEQRVACAREVTRVTDPGATLLLFAFSPGRRGPLPRGVSRDDVAGAFARWSIADELAADTSAMPGPLKKSNPRWYTLIRN